MVRVGCPGTNSIRVMGCQSARTCLNRVMLAEPVHSAVRSLYIMDTSPSLAPRVPVDSVAHISISLPGAWCLILGLRLFTRALALALLLAVLHMLLTHSNEHNYL